MKCNTCGRKVTNREQVQKIVEEMQKISYLHQTNPTMIIDLHDWEELKSKFGVEK